MQTPVDAPERDARRIIFLLEFYEYITEEEHERGTERACRNDLPNDGGAV
jgi:hypothetical protein